LNADSKWTLPFNKLIREELNNASKAMEGLEMQVTQEVRGLRAKWSKAQLQPLTPDRAEHILHLATPTARCDCRVAVAVVEEPVTWWMSFAVVANSLFAKATGKLLGMQVTICSPEGKWSQQGLVSIQSRSRL
jgi:hypothetical protein